MQSIASVGVALIAAAAILCPGDACRAADGKAAATATTAEQDPASLIVAPVGRTPAPVALVAPTIEKPAELKTALPPSPHVTPQTPSPAAPAAPAALAPIPAKDLFGAVKTPSPMAARAIGFYSRGCLAGGHPLPIDGAEWQAMRTSRNRNWGMPELVSFIQRFADDARRFEDWPGLLVGDMSQPRGGPMVSSHASHQVGLDVDIWYSPMPRRHMTSSEREETQPINLVAADKISVSPATWNERYIRLLKRAASFGEVERIFVHPAVKKAICTATANDPDRTWLSKIRPLWGHDDHFHVRIKCPESMLDCKPQPQPTAEDGCGQELTEWLARVSRPVIPTPDAKPSPPDHPITLSQLPPECAQLVVDSQKTAVAPAAPLPVIKPRP